MMDNKHKNKISVMKFIKILNKLQKLQKHMEKDEKLRKEMCFWMENEFKIPINNVKEFIAMLQSKPENINLIVQHYEEIKKYY